MLVVTGRTESEIESRQVWDARGLARRSSWRITLPADVAGEFGNFCRWHPDRVADADAFEFDPADLPRLCAFAAGVRANLLVGDGVCWISGLSVLGLGPEEHRVFYVALGCAMGEPMTQYGRLYEVADRGASYKESTIPVSQTCAATGFHTDSSARETLPDFVGLLCERPSTRGGESLISNALRARQVLRHESPTALALLEREYVRDVVTPGTERNIDNLRRNRIPVFAPTARVEGTVFRYMRYWIERGQERAGQPLDSEALAALDALDAVLGAPENVVTFQLRASDILFVNNRTIAHSRSDYEDTPGNVRRLWRLWIKVS